MCYGGESNSKVCTITSLQQAVLMDPCCNSPQGEALLWCCLFVSLLCVLCRSGVLGN